MRFAQLERASQKVFFTIFSSSKNIAGDGIRILLTKLGTSIEKAPCVIRFIESQSAKTVQQNYRYRTNYGKHSPSINSIKYTGLRNLKLQVPYYMVRAMANQPLVMNLLFPR